jgi:NitT/TauT family transport system ATP-binding protein
VSLLGLAILEKGDILLTALGKEYAVADQARKQELFGQQLLMHVPLAAHIRRVLEAETSGSISEQPLLEMLEDFLKPGEAQRCWRWRLNGDAMASV